MLKIGIIGPNFLVNKNKEILKEKDCQVIALQTEKQIYQVDGIIITGWQEKHYVSKVNCWSKSLKEVKNESVAFLGIAYGAVTLAKNGRLKLMDYKAQVSSMPITKLPLEIPSLNHARFTACFLPDIRFSDLAPNLGILCQDKQRGPVILRQGNYLAGSYVAELTAKTYLYDYWLEMVLSAKMT